MPELHFAAPAYFLTAKGAADRRGCHQCHEHPGLQHHPHQSKKFFDAVGCVTDDGGEWLRRQALLMAQGNNTPAPYWLAMPLYQLRQWIDTNNAIVAEREKARKAK